MNIRSRDLQSLQKLGFLSPGQSDAILEYQKNSQKGSFAWLSFLMLVFSVGLIVLGINQILSAYREQLSRPEILGMMVVQVILACVCWFLARRKRPALAQVFALLAFGLWAASVGTCNDLYHFTDDAVDVLAVIFLGAVAIPFVSRQLVLIGVIAAFSHILWVAMSESSGTSPLALCSSVDLVTKQSVILLLFLLWFLLGEKWRLSTGIHRNYDWISFPDMYVLIQGMAGLCFLADASTTRFSFASLLAFVPLLLFALIRPREYPLRWWMLPAAATVLVMLSTLLPLNAWLHAQLALGIRILSCALYAAAYIVCGLKFRRPSWLIYAAMMLFYVFLALASDVARSPEFSSFFLILGSLLLFYVARKLSRASKLWEVSPFLPH